MEWIEMASEGKNRGRVEAAIGAIVADGCFCLAFIMHLVSGGSGLTAADLLGMGVIASVFATACCVIYEDYWLVHGNSTGTSSIIKRLRITELHEGAAIEFDGQRYRVDNINRAKGEILIERIGRPGCIIVQIQGEA
jgi:hypothetical protein